MRATDIPFERGTLWDVLKQRAQGALECGALQPITTRQIILPAYDVDFVVRMVSTLAGKHKQRKQTDSEAKGASRNPFLPYDPPLFVGAVSDRHIVLLNKFYVIENHLLIVTREFEPQESLLNQEDFAAWFRCMREYNSLGFYNGGVEAGASQSHKHMQLIPLPLSGGGYDFPVMPIFSSAHNKGDTSSNTYPQNDYLKNSYWKNSYLKNKVLHCAFPFRHGLIALDTAKLQDLPAAAAYLFDCYTALLAAVGIQGVEVEGGARQSAPYNLLISQQWMWLVPRSQECYQGISVNALGYAGSLFVRNTGQLQTVRHAGPMDVLRSVSVQ